MHRALRLFVGLVDDWSARGETGDGVSRGDGGGAHRIKRVKGNAAANIQKLLIFFFPVQNRRNMQMARSFAFVSHCRPLKGGHKGRKWFQTGKRDPQKAGVRVYT